MNANATPALAMPRRAALYLRVSTGRQAEQDLSIPDQRRQLVGYCEGRGIEIVAEYVEPGASATDDKRPSFQRMMDEATQKPPPFDTIIVHSFSRFFRDQFQLEFYFRRLAKNGVKLTSITQDLGEDPMSAMMRQIMALFDEYQSKENAKHTLRAMRENARQGYWNGSRPPFGYRIVAAEMRGARTKKKIEPDPALIDTVRMIFRLARLGVEGGDGPMGVRQIAHYLNGRGLRTQTGGRWGIGTVHDLLTRSTYMGVHRFNVSGKRKGTTKNPEDIVEVAVPAIIDKEEFEEVGEMMRSRAHQLKAARFVSGGTLLGGVVFCADCGGAMTLRTSGKGEEYRYYTCCTAARQGKTGCNGRSIRMDELDGLVVDHLETRLLAPKRLETVLAGIVDRRADRVDKEKDRITALRHLAADTEEKLTRLYRAIEEGLADLDDPNLKGRITELKRIRDSAKADVERAEGRDAKAPTITMDSVQEFAKAVRTQMRREDGSFRRSQIQMLVQRAEVGANQILIRGSALKLLQTLAEASGGKPRVETAGLAVRSSVLNWLPGPDSNRRPVD
ncbi:recombinase family protein [Rhizobium rhizogenes]|uniref:recombinase family protein n=1 Tax=Rhizobium rhizogenes TaxID=359 RepID=UPI002868C409|nr:recombinase family protein [Rhizobium rhizogenes]